MNYYFFKAEGKSIFIGRSSNCIIEALKMSSKPNCMIQDQSITVIQPKIKGKRRKNLNTSA